jgi:hypothetical protein
MTSGAVLGSFRLVDQVDDYLKATSFTAVKNGGVGAWIELISAEVPAPAIQRLKDQRTALSKMRKARAPELIEVGEQERSTYLVVRRSHGETLASRMRRGSLGAIETLDLLIELGEALAEAHAVGIAHGRLSEKSIFFTTEGSREEIQILGFGLAGLGASPTEQPTPQDDLRSLGRLAYRCLAGLESLGLDPPQKILEKQPHLQGAARELVLRLLEGNGIESATALAQLARDVRTSVTTDIVPIRPSQQRDVQKIEVVLRATIEAANNEAPPREDSMPGATLDETTGVMALPRPRAPSAPNEPRPVTEPQPPPGMSLIDGKTLFIAGAILILLILGVWVITAAGGGSQDVMVESLSPK